MQPQICDDTFAIFMKPEHALNFLGYLNNQHINIIFTEENEQNESIPFLDMNISHSNGQLSTSIYRKPSFSGLGTSFFNHTLLSYKVDVIN